MATQLPNRFRCRGNRGELAFSRVARLGALAVRCSCVCVHVFHLFRRLVSSSFCVLSLKNPIWLFLTGALCFDKLTGQDNSPEAYVSVTLPNTAAEALVVVPLRRCMDA